MSEGILDNLFYKNDVTYILDNTIYVFLRVPEDTGRKPLPL